ncbi:GNAT family N-acetyltransferase [Patescibacteria group bacterium]
MNKNIEIKRMNQEDMPGFVRLWNQGYKLLTSSRFKMDLYKALEGFKKKMFDYFGLYKNGELIGFILFTKEKSNVWLKHMLVDNVYRKKGLGSFFLNKALERYKGVTIKTEVLFDNKQAYQFFIKNRFVFENKDNIEKQNILYLNN